MKAVSHKLIFLADCPLNMKFHVRDIKQIILIAFHKFVIFDLFTVLILLQAILLNTYLSNMEEIGVLRLASWKGILLVKLFD